MTQLVSWTDKRLDRPVNIEIDGQIFSYGAEDLVVGNFNNDPWLDLFFSMVTYEGMGEFPVPVLMAAGQPDGSFTINTADFFSAQTQVPSINWAPRVISADFNSDGLLDVFIPDFGQDAPPFPGAQNYFIMSSNTGYTATLAGMPEELNFTHGASVGDVDNDGDLDLLVNNLNSSTGRSVQLLINDGTGFFEEQNQRLPSDFVSEQFNGGHTWSIIEDFNNDGFKDIVLGAWTNQEKTTLHLNDGSGSFERS